MKILFVDNHEEEFTRFMKLPFAEEHAGEIEYLRSPVGLKRRVADDPEIRLIILDLMWEEGDTSKPILMGLDAMEDLAEVAAEIPVVIYSVLDDEDDYDLRTLIPQALGLGAYDWIGKTEPWKLRSYRFERAFMAGRSVLNRPASRAILPPDQQHRKEVHVAILFIDMCGFTALTKVIGAEAVVDILRAFYKLVGEAVTSNHGYIDKYIGDAVMAVFGASYGHNPALFPHGQLCVAAATQIQAHSPRFRLEKVLPILQNKNVQWPANRVGEIGKFRVGIESGPVDIVRFERGNESELTFIGTPVNIASRILGLSGPDEIWVGENLHGTALIAGQEVEEKDEEYKNLPGNFRRYRIRF